MSWCYAYFQRDYVTNFIYFYFNVTAFCVLHFQSHVEEPLHMLDLWAEQQHAEAELVAAAAGNRKQRRLARTKPADFGYVFRFERIDSDFKLMQVLWPGYFGGLGCISVLYTARVN